jgi:glutamate N-acetyltransferase/amino-acid N-acetyltransferase
MYKLKEITGSVCAPEGFYADGIAAGLKPDGARDLAFIYSQGLCDVASVFTTNRMTAAPIRHFAQKGEFQTNFILLNAKNANAMTGKAGIADIDEILEKMKLKNPQITNPLMSSTGVIGVRLPKEKIISASLTFDLEKRDADAASKAIMTTDTYAKTIAYEVELEDGSSFRIGAMAKGAGMINPAMATMLCFITTDADVDAKTMQLILDETTPVTFNAASVDGDTSTNDTVLLLSNRTSGAFDHAAFKEALYRIMLHLAKLMVADGEGATKLVTYRVSGAMNNHDAELAAKALSNSLLVKTALYGEDPNWGRIASTVGASGAICDEEYLSIWFDDICVYKKGEILFDEATERRAAEVMKKDAFEITCDLGLQDGSFTAYGCDLGHEYVKINADYRT